MVEASDGFLKFARRFNAAALMLILTMIGIAVAWSLFMPFSPSSARHTTAPGETPDSQDFHLNDVQGIDGTKLLYIRLVTSSLQRGFSSGGKLNETHNLLFFDPVEKNSHWLLPGNDQVISSFAFLTNPPSNNVLNLTRFGGDGQPHDRQGTETATALLLLLQPAAAQAQDLALATADGHDLTVIAKQIDELLGYRQTAKDSLLLFYTSNGVARVMDYDLARHASRSDGPLTPQK